LKEEVFLPHPLHVGKFYLDLRMANKLQLMECGIKDSNISSVDMCSHCEETLISYRRSPKKEGRMLSFIGITSAKTLL
jgi:copper oxidase (laccase) domain-containing protein